MPAPEEFAEGGAEALAAEGHRLLGLKQTDAAVACFARAADAAPSDVGMLAALGFALRLAGNPRGARTVRQAIALGWPVYLDPPRPGHEATILVLSSWRKPVLRPDTALRMLHLGGNYVGQAALELEDRLRFASIFAELPDEALPGDWPEADIVINNIVNPEMVAARGLGPLLTARADRLGVPVINHPDRVRLATRPGNAARLAGIPGLRIPAIAHLTNRPGEARALAREIGERVGYPAILRRPAAQQSAESQRPGQPVTVALAADPAAAAAHLEASGWRDFYALEFVDLKRPDGFYGKTRAVVIDGEAIVTKHSIYHNWLVGGWNQKPEAVAFLRANPSLIGEMRRAAAEPEGYYGKAALETLDEIGRRMGLDMFGIDFGLDRDGQVVLFEASAAMSFTPDQNEAPPDLRHDPEPFARVHAAFRALIARRIARRAAQAPGPGAGP